MIPRVGTCTKLAAKIQDTHRKGLELTLAGPNDCQYTPQKCAGKRSTWVASFGITLFPLKAFATGRLPHRKIATGRLP